MTKYDDSFGGLLTGRDKVELLLRAQGYASVRAIAQELGEHESDVSRTLNSHPGRAGTSDRIRDGMAKLAKKKRRDIDKLLGPVE